MIHVFRMRRARLIVACSVAVLATACTSPDPAQSLAKARASFAGGDYRTALIYAENAVQADGGNAAARVLLGRIDLILGNVPAAREQLERAKASGASADQFAVPLATAYLRSSKPRQAIALLDGVPGTHRGADYWLARAGALLQQRQYEESLAAVGEAEKAGGRTARSVLERARVASAEGDRASALKLAGTALSLDASDADALAFRGALLASSNAPAAAQRDLERAADRYEAQGRLAFEAPVLLELVRLRLAANRVDAAAKTAERLSKILPKTSAANFAEALVAYKQRRFNDAIELLRVALAKTPNQPELSMLLGAAQLGAGNPALAEQQLRAVLKQDPSNAAAMRLLAEARLGQDRPKAALDALRNYPSGTGEQADAAVALLRARAQAADHDTQGALETLRAAAQAAPSAVDVHVALGRLELQTGDSQGARQIAEDLQRRFAQRPAGFALEGRVKMAGHDYAGAASLYRRAYGLQPSWPLLAETATALSLGKDDGWEALIRDWMQRSPKDVRGPLLLGQLYQANGRRAEALDAYEQAIALDKSNVIALNNAAGLAQDLGKGNALDYAQRAAAAAPNSAPVLDTLGWILTQRSRAGDGLQYLQRATQLSPGALEIRYHLAVAQARAGQKGAARKTLESLLAEKGPFAQRGAARKLLDSL